MQAGFELGRQCSVDRPVPGQTGQPGKGIRPDSDRIMRLASRPGARVPMVQVAFVHYLQFARRKSSLEGRPNAFRTGCQFLWH